MDEDHYVLLQIDEVCLKRYQADFI